MTRSPFYAENLTRNTSTPTSYGDFVILNFTPKANTDYIVLGMAVLDCTDNTTNTDVRLQDVTNDVTIGAAVHRSSIPSSAAKRPFFWTAKLSYGSSPSEQTIKLQWQRASGSGTVGIDKGRILLIEAGASDNFAENTSEASATSDSSYSTAVTLNFTAPASGDCLLIFSGEFQGSQSDPSNGVAWKINDGSSDVWTCSRMITPSNSAPWFAVGGMVRKTGLSGSTSYTLQLRNTAGFGHTVKARRARIWALDVAGFEAFDYDEDAARSTYNTDTADQNKVGVTLTPAAAEHVVIAAALLDGNNSSTTAQSVYKHKEGGSVVDQIERDHYDNSDREIIVTFYRKTMAAEETGFDLDYATENTANTVGISEARIAVLQTGAAGGDPDPEPSALLPILLAH